MSAWFGVLLGAAAIGAWLPAPLRARAFRAGWFERAGETTRSRGERRPTHGGLVAGVGLALGALVAGPGDPTGRAALVALAVALAAGAVCEHHHRAGLLRAGRVAAALAVPLAGARAELTGTWATDVVLTAVGALALVEGLARLDRTDGAMVLVAGLAGSGLLVASVRVGEAPVAALAAALAGAGLALAGQMLPPGTLLAGRTGPGVFGVVLATGLVGHDPRVAAPTSAAVPLLLGAVPLVGLLVPGLGLRLAARRLPPAASLGVAAVAASLGAVLVDGGDLPLAVGAVVALGPIGVLAVVGIASPRPEVLGPRPAWLVPAVAGLGAAALVVGGYAGLAALDARGDVLEGRELAQAGLGAARDGELEAAQESFAAAEVHFDAAASRLGSPLVELAEVTIPGVAQNLRAADALIASGSELASTAVAVADRAGADDLQVVDGRVPVDAAAEVGDELGAAREVLAETRDRLVGVDSPWLVGEAREASSALAAQVADADASIEVAAEVTRLLPGLLGGDGTRRWFVAVLAPSELRGAGGLLGNYAVLDAVDGELSLEVSGGVSELNATTDDATAAELLPPVYGSLYSSWSPARFWQNLTVTPDFPTVGDAVVALAPASSAGPVAGVVGIDPLGLAALVELTGPVSVPSWPEPLDAASIADVLLFEQYVAFGGDEEALDDFQTEVVEAVVDALTTGELPAPPELVATLAPAVAEGHLRLFSPDGDEQALFDRIGASGALVAPDRGDFFQLVSQNGSESKIDHFLRRRIDYAVEVDPATGAATATATVTLANEAPVDGLPPYVIGGRDGSITSAGEMRFFTTVHSAMPVVGVSIDGGPELPVQLGSEGELFTGTVLHRIPPGATSTLVFRLAGVLPVGGGYEVVVGRQPTAFADELVVRADGVVVEVSQDRPVRLPRDTG